VGGGSDSQSRLGMAARTDIHSFMIHMGQLGRLSQVELESTDSNQHMLMVKMADQLARGKSS